MKNKPDELTSQEEGGRFERPALSSYRVAGGCLKPLGQPSEEGVGVEPTDLSTYGFRDRRHRPLGHPSVGRVGIEPTTFALSRRRSTSELPACIKLSKTVLSDRRDSDPHKLV